MTHHQQQQYATGQTAIAVPQQPPMSAAQVVAKLRQDLNAVQNNYTVLGDMLSELTPGRESPDDARLLQVCYYNCNLLDLNLVVSLECSWCFKQLPLWIIIVGCTNFVICLSSATIIIKTSKILLTSIILCNNPV